jgi:nucleoside-diphosphate-sugar epimerase
VDVALAAGVTTFVYPSVVFVYGEGGAQWQDAATTPPAVDPRGVLVSTLDAEAEVARFAAGGGHGVSLRMGGFYGQTSTTDELLGLARRFGLLPLPGPVGGYVPTIWVEDAAAAVIAALERAPSGVYDVVDDEPLTRAEFADTVAQLVSRRRVRRLPSALFRLLAPAALEALGPGRRVSNRRFKEATGWQPAVPGVRAGLQRLAAANSTTLLERMAPSDVAVQLHPGDPVIDIGHR